MVREILVVKTDTLFEGVGQFQGFCPVEYKDFTSIVLNNFEFRERSEMETNPDFQQIVSYVWIINPKTKQVFAYRRAPDNRYNEERLRDKWSCGLGGHVDKGTEDGTENPLESAMLRELQEEVTMPEHSEPKVIGFLNDNLNDVGKVHFGVVAIVESENVSKGDDEMVHGQFYSIEELEKVFANPESNVENWTQLSWPFVREYLQKL